MAYFLSSPRSRSRRPARRRPARRRAAQRRAAWTAICALLLQVLHGGAMAAGGPSSGLTSGGLTPDSLTPDGLNRTGPDQSASPADPPAISLEAALARLCTPSGIQTAAPQAPSATDTHALSCPFCPTACDGHVLGEPGSILAVAWPAMRPTQPLVSPVAERSRYCDSRPRAPPARL